MENPIELFNRVKILKGNALIVLKVLVFIGPKQVIMEGNFKGVFVP